ncbi:sensor histidine kinase [Paenibacillus donghaensis]|uniref:sensor histidine kinase n=1 Tax=Paenibacillus donghaensis TaxID=414771 RepID=UPI0018835152|nr:histidine kinase [Paenibacillus donghaensis]MBE9915186.1 sensor histidine kinase [Paenibacillus donghaensis]
MSKVSGKLYIPYTYKMMIPYLILVLLTDVVIGYISYTMLIKSRTEMAETNIRTALEQTKNNMKYQMDEIQRMSNTLFTSISFQDALQIQGEPLNIMLKTRDEIVPQMKAPLLLFGNNIRLALYTINAKIYEIPGDDMSKPITKRDYYILSARSIENSEWFKSLQSSKKDNLWLQIDSDRELGNISHFRKLISSGGYSSVIGYIRVTARFDDLLSSFDTFPIEEGINLRLIDAASGTAMYKRGNANQLEGSFFTLQEAIPGTSFIIEALVPHAYLNKDAGRMQQAIGMVCLISFLVMAGIGLIVARLSGKKMKRIVTLVGSFQEGNFYKRIQFSGNDEFVHIADAFNAMARSIQDLIRNVYEQGIQKKQAELDALQAQINPHFLYNTLSTIGSLANLGETRKVTKMVKGLAKFYRLTLNEGHVYVSLEQELEQVETYLEIQRVKYANNFTVYMDIDPEIKNVKVIKLILQPFVENIFKHAWFGETIAIRITGHRLKDCIELKIIDNGIGMKPETLRKMLSTSTQSDGYGLINVQERIKLRYGSDFGIHIASIFGAGTTVQILLPIDNIEVNET